MVKQLKRLKITDEEREKYTEWICNWSYLSISFQSEELTERTLLVLIQLELEGKNREAIIHRLFTRYCKLKNLSVWKDLKTYANGKRKHSRRASQA